MPPSQSLKALQGIEIKSEKLFKLPL